MVRVGVIGSSEWTQRMYLKPLADHPDGAVTALCARNPQHTAAIAAQYNIARHYTHWRDLLDSDGIDAVIIATPNDTHFPIAMHALKNDIHVLCEKPLALNYAQADAIATEAERRALYGMTAFTHWFFPHYRYVARLVQQGYVGRPLHFNWRYYSGMGLSGDPVWRFDRRQAGEGALADIGAHAFAVARVFLGPVATVSAQLHTGVVRAGIPVQHRASDQAAVTMRFANGALGVIHVSLIAYQPPREGIRQEFTLGGTGGTLYYTNDFSSHFRLRGAQPGDDTPHDLTVPADLWPANVSRANPQAMYADLYTKTDAMAREFVSAIADGRPIVGPGLREGAEVQRLIDAAVESHQQDGGWVRVAG